ncbi:hypothetical protein DFH29DRAFT_71113 [Suillus ampliporus]|nr:hypothetical protein DFH29DRAFT_71113 [Suillus ampliporus]
MGARALDAVLLPTARLLLSYLISHGYTACARQYWTIDYAGLAEERKRVSRKWDLHHVFYEQSQLNSMEGFKLSAALSPELENAERLRRYRTVK